MSAHEPWCTRSHNDATCKTDLEPPDPERYEVPDEAYEDLEDLDFEYEDHGDMDEYYPSDSDEFDEKEI